MKLFGRKNKVTILSETTEARYIHPGEDRNRVRGQVDPWWVTNAAPQDDPWTEAAAILAAPQETSVPQDDPWAEAIALLAAPQDDTK